MDLAQAGLLVGVAEDLGVGIAQLQLGDRGVVAFHQARAGLCEGAHRHQGRALGDARAAFRRDLAGIVVDASHRDTRGIALRPGMTGQADQRFGIGGRVGRDRRAVFIWNE